MLGQILVGSLTHIRVGTTLLVSLTITQWARSQLVEDTLQAFYLGMSSYMLLVKYGRGSWQVRAHLGLDHGCLTMVLIGVVRTYYS